MPLAGRPLTTAAAALGRKDLAGAKAAIAPAAACPVADGTTYAAHVLRADGAVREGDWATVREEPVEVVGAISTPEGDPRFATVEDQVSFFLRFPSGALANCATGYDGHKQARLSINGQTGWIDMERAFEYRGQRLHLARREGDQEQV